MMLQGVHFDGDVPTVLQAALLWSLNKQKFMHLLFLNEIDMPLRSKIVQKHAIPYWAA